MATRTLAEYLGTDLEIYTGAWGVLELDDVNANPVEVYLGLTASERVVPAPAVTWKVGVFLFMYFIICLVILIRHGISKSEANLLRERQSDRAI